MLAIGYGSGAMPSFSYIVLEMGNIGFLKLLVSTRPIHSPRQLNDNSLAPHCLIDLKP